MRFVVGVDPGPIVGMCALRLPANAAEPWYAELAQVTPNGVHSVLAGWCAAYDVVALAAEAFVVGPRASRLNDPEASRIARDVLAGLRPGDRDGVRYQYWFERRATEVKPWASDARLKAAGLYQHGTNMRHALDAVRHALFAACRDYGAAVPRISTDKGPAV